MHEPDQKQKLNALVALCRELAACGVRVALSDARPALSVRHELTDPKVWVEIDTSGESFVWRRDDYEHHEIDDPAGAATRITEYLKTRDVRRGPRGR
ncbi:hypothetical protein NE235_21080 [Actinoallomurus spadix]|uniref:Uncharacterized protein n=1 Tax=Actinoallomurus spadix TaxID=79912 RepID=A0ABP3FZL3_9ACTN|nr:hypothetical protein [Actinoallomurus spadix]MCO5988604.1 hypothetical protein [Actinoallomurus spadix]